LGAQSIAESRSTKVADACADSLAGNNPAPEPIAGRDGEQPSAALELARAEARICALQDLLARQDDELVFLRRLAVGQLDKAS
jgi:hypothetical protein